MNLVGVDELHTASYDVLDSLLDLLGPCTFPLGIERLGDEEALLTGAITFVQRFPRAPGRLMRACACKKQ